MSKIIKEIWAFISTEPETGEEGVIGSKIGDSWFPLVAADPKRVNFFFPFAQSIAQTAGVKVSLKKFSNVTIEIENICEEGLGAKTFN